MTMVFLSFAMSFASLVIRVWRWEFVVSASRQVRFRSLFSATQIGMLVNTVIPARIGDVVRAWVLTTLERIPLVGSLTLVALDRINDVLALLVVLLVAIWSFPGNHDIEFPAGTFGNSEAFVVSSALIGPVATALSVGLLAVIVLLLALYFFQEKILWIIDRVLGRRAPGVTEWISGQFKNVAESMHVLGSPYRSSVALVLSLMTWGAMALSFAFLFSAFDIPYAWYGPILMLAILGVFTSVTISPGMVGQYHIPVVAGLLMVSPGVDIDQAKAYAIVAHLVAFVPPIVLGTWSLLRERFGFLQLLPGTGSPPLPDDESP